MKQAKLYACMGGIFALWLTAAWVMPLLQDEAYYAAWAVYPDLGYFDHPPLVALTAALIAKLTSLLPPFLAAAASSALLVRLGNLLLAGLTLLAAARFFRLVGLTTPRARTIAVALAFGNLMGLAMGFINTPDTGLMLAWVLALSEAALALRGDGRRWLTAGLAVGFGLWAKYIMLLMGLVFLWALVEQNRQKPRAKSGLRTPWPYLGGVCALLVVLPHLMWNAQHDWITIRFQLHHGFAKEHIAAGAETMLPEPMQPFFGSREWELAQVFKSLREDEEKHERAPKFYDPVLKSVNRYFGYYGSQIGAWGALVVAIGFGLRDRRRSQQRWRATLAASSLYPETVPLLIAAALVPLLVFGLFSLGTQVEANWSAMYIFGAAALLTPLLLSKQKSLTYGLAVNALILALVLVHAQTGLLPLRPHRDRILAETHGYRSLASYLAALPKTGGPIFADSYQLTAMLNFYSSPGWIRQWPGITRDSEFVRRREMSDVGADTLHQDGGFWLVTTGMPPALFGFSASEMMQLRDCKDADLQVISTSAARETVWRCKKPIHEWYLVRYETTPSSE